MITFVIYFGNIYPALSVIHATSNYCFEVKNNANSCVTSKKIQDNAPTPC